MYLYCVAKENNDLLLYFCACGENVGKNQANKKAKRLIVNRLAFHSVPRPGVEPGWMLLHWCLRPARLPIPPSGQLLSGICFSLIAVQRYEHLSNLPNISLVFSLHTQHFDIFIPSKYIFYER